jgi:hypothetical protein
MAFNPPPIPTYTREVDKLEKTYRKALTKIVKQLEKVDPQDLLHQSIYESQIQQLAFLIRELNGEAQKWIEETLTDAFQYSQASAMVTMGLAGSLVEAKGKHTFSLMSQQRLEAIISDTFTDVLKAHSIMEESMKQLVRDVQAEVLRTNVAMQRGTVTSAKDMRSALLKEGFSKSLVEESWKGITDAGGKRWDLTTYTKMVARTKLQQTQLEGATQMALENESDLAVISSHGAKDACRSYEGVIVSLTGRTWGYMTLAEARGSGLIFHPNCQHSVHPIGDIEALPKKVKDKADRQQVKAVYANENAEQMKREDNARRYREQKEERERLKEQRRKALEKAREARKKARSQ